MSEVKREVEELCCFCFNNEELVSLLDSCNHEGTLAIYLDMITKCFGLKLNSTIDQIENVYKICKTCVLRLRSALEFRIRISLALERIQAIAVNEIRIKQEPEESCCCFCYSNKDLLNILNTKMHDEKSDIYATVISRCYGIEIKTSIDDVYKNLYMICNLCIMELKNALLFRRQVQSAYNRMQDLKDQIDNEIGMKRSPKISNIKYEFKAKDEDVSLFPPFKEKIEYIGDHFLNMDSNHYSSLDSSYGTEDNASFNEVGPKMIGQLDGKVVICKSVLEGNTLSNNILKEFQCEVCRKSFLTSFSLKRHSKIHGNIKDFKCNYCGKAFTQKCTLKKHILLHSGVKSHHCEICGKSFSVKQYLTLHMVTHNNRRDFVCSICGRAFGRKDALRSHVTIHIEEKDISCEICKKSFSLESHLKRHLKRHANHTILSCSVCEKKFTRTDTLKIHMYTHSEMKNFHCQICGKSFAKKQLLVQHAKIHQNIHFQCEQCGKIFRTKQCYKKHMINHESASPFDSTVKPFPCQLCPKSFVKQRSLRQHMDIHRDNRKYVCDHCGRAFLRKHGLRIHIATHTKI